jgi:hypothetical protein
MSCAQYLLTYKFEDTLTVYLTDQIEFNSVTRAFPLFFDHNGVDYGLLMGIDATLYGDKIAQFRAIRTEFNQSDSLVSELESYQLVFKEAGDTLVREQFDRLWAEHKDDK